MKVKLLVVCALALLPACYSEERSYEVAAETETWCWKYPDSWGRYAAVIRLTQLLDDYALYSGRGYKIMLPRAQIDGELFPGKSLAASAKYIGYVQDVSLQDQRGFEVVYGLWDVIGKEDFKKSPKKKGGGRSCETW